MFGDREFLGCRSDTPLELEDLNASCFFSESLVVSLGLSLPSAVEDDRVASLFAFLSLSSVSLILLSMARSSWFRDVTACFLK